MGCHNASAAPHGSYKKSYATWVELDRHARAYETLFSAKSRQIVRNLHGRSANEGTTPHRETLCLQCHVMPNAQLVAHHHFHADGVSCESCHGPAEEWLNQHYKPHWRRLPSATKARLGMRDTRSLTGRVAVCIDCHVGAPGMEVNHDLIAAGHPDLKFEFAAYHALMPHHWSDAADRNPALGGRPDFEVRAWALGQAASAGAALKLLEHRAAAPQAPWPEFAEHDCFACHHSLKASSKRTTSQRRLGAAPARQWYFAELKTLRRFATDDATLDERLEALAAELSKPLPNRKRIESLAHDGAAETARLQTRLDIQVIRGGELFSSMTSDNLPAGSWDAAAQRFLGLAALHREKCTPQSPNVRHALETMRHLVKNPIAHTPADFECLLRTIRGLTE